MQPTVAVHRDAQISALSSSFQRYTANLERVVRGVEIGKDKNEDARRIAIEYMNEDLNDQVNSIEQKLLICSQSILHSSEQMTVNQLANLCTTMYRNNLQYLDSLDSLIVSESSTTESQEGQLLDDEYTLGDTATSEVRRDLRGIISHAGVDALDNHQTTTSSAKKKKQPLPSPTAPWEFPHHPGVVHTHDNTNCFQQDHTQTQTQTQTQTPLQPQPALVSPEHHNSKISNPHDHHSYYSSSEINQVSDDSATSIDSIDAWRYERRSSVAFDTHQLANSAADARNLHQNKLTVEEWRQQRRSSVAFDTKLLETGTPRVAEHRASDTQYQITGERKQKTNEQSISNETQTDRRHTLTPSRVQIDQRLNAIRKSLSPNFFLVDQPLNHASESNTGLSYSADELEDEGGFSELSSERDAKDYSSSIASETVKGAGYYKKQAMLSRGKQQQFHSDVPQFIANNHPEDIHHEDLTLNESILAEISTSSPFDDQLFKKFDESLLVTPVLDRYRLEADDSSFGVRVVPNERGFGKQRNTTPHPPYSTPASTEKQTAKPTYTIKPYDLDPIEEVALSPNVSLRRSAKKKHISSKKELFKNTSGKNGSTKDNHSDGRENGRYSDRNFSRMSTTKTWIAEKLEEVPPFSSPMAMSEKSFSAGHNRLHIDIDLEGKSLPGRWANGAIAIPAISVNEFESSPRVVKTLVTLDEANEATVALNSWMETNEQSPEYVRLTEEQAGQILQQPARKSKSLLMALCHWRRLNMVKGDTPGNMHFVPNQRRRTARLTV